MKLYCDNFDEDFTHEFSVGIYEEPEIDSLSSKIQAAENVKNGKPLIVHEKSIKERE